MNQRKEKPSHEDANKAMNHGIRNGKQIDYTIHPALAIIPEMDAKTFAGLKADIKENGQEKWITFFDGQLLDGRARLKACQELGIEPLIEEIEDSGEGKFDPVDWVLSVNVFRQHLTESQRTMVATKRAARQPQTMRTQTKP
jgi:hypothetical protein